MPAGEEVVAGAGALTRPPRLPALTGIRALAALWVVLVHLRLAIEQAIPAAKHLDPLMSAGYLGVDLFFVLSGFILAYTYVDTFGSGVKRASYLRFIQLRLARIYPLQLLTLHVEVALFLAARLAHLRFNHPDASVLTLASYLQNLFLVHIWFTQKPSWNGPAWSISAEFFAYLLFPFLALAVARRAGRWASLVGAVVAYAVLIASFLLFFPHQSATNGALVRVACEFAAGVFLYRIWATTPSAKLMGWLSVPVGALLVALPWAVPAGTYRQGIVYAPILGLLVFCLAYDRGPLARLLSTRSAVFWGEASFALYMTHEIVVQVANKVIPARLWTLPGPIRVVPLALLLGGIAVAAAGTYRLFERPARSWVRSLDFSRRRPRSRPAPAAEPPVTGTQAP